MSSREATLTAYQALFESHLRYMKLLTGEDIHRVTYWPSLSRYKDSSQSDGCSRVEIRLQTDFYWVGASQSRQPMCFKSYSCQPQENFQETKTITSTANDIHATIFLLIMPVSLRGALLCRHEVLQVGPRRNEKFWFQDTEKTIKNLAKSKTILFTTILWTGRTT